ncbi:phage tail sheath C-terminal domain-containing protein [Pacificoceanicola onchidii]|uniref:phage tail sheath C-terminal domain-containing protein n=1 Tax=Pacificoceanicola onchidii TaxID=2562685 RepID=UPI0010A53704|nr:phage tail sheath C-terminal domain-containing protein [Pacificoceanicola onchidii]
MLANQFPGVHVKEIPSGVRPIASISTSNTVFADVFKRGPVNEAVRLTSWANFEDTFGGLWALSEASYAIQQYFLNGGNVAFVIRVGAGGAQGAAKASGVVKSQADQQGGDDAITVDAASDGAWGNSLRIGIGKRNEPNTYDLLVRQYSGTTVVAEEVYEGITVNGGANNNVITRVNNTSALIDVTPRTQGGVATRLPAFSSGGNEPDLAALLDLGKDDLIPLIGGLPEPQFVESTLNIRNDVNQANVGAPQVLTVKAKNPGSWGNDLRIGIAENASVANGYDLMVRLFSGSTLVGEEIFQGITSTADKGVKTMAENVINAASRFIEVTVSTDPGLNDVSRRPKFGLPDAQNVLNEVNLEALKEAKPEDLLKPGGGDDGLVPGVANWEAPISTALQGSGANRTGLHALENIVPDIFNLMCLPVASKMPHGTAKGLYEAAEKFCRDRFAFLILDPGEGVAHTNIYADWYNNLGAANSRNTAGYYPRLSFQDPLDPTKTRNLGPSGMVAGMMSRIDATRGIWKSAAGTETRYAGGSPEYGLTDLEQEPLNRLGINAIRSFPVYGDIIWGARTRAGADAQADEYKYIAVRRTALFIQQSLQKGLTWVVFEGNDEKLWGQIRMNVKAFMQGLHRQGAFQGSIADDAYLVKCDAETTTQADIDLGIVNILVAFAPLKPAEFVVLNFKQLARLPE